MTKAEYLKRLDKLHSQISKAFAEAVYNRVARASVAEVVEGVIAGNIDAVAKAVGLTQADMTELLETVRAGYVQAGVAEAVALKTVFDITNPAAEKWLREKSAELVVLAADSNQTAIREGIRQAVAQGMELGRAPRSVALDIVGRINSRTKRREGGLVGLYDQQVSYVLNAQKELATLNPNYLTRKARDRRFDGVFERAIRDGKPLTGAQVDAMTARYSDRLLKVRGDTIGRTEALTAIASGEEDARQQALDDGILDEEFTIKTWSASSDSRTRDTHAEMHGQERKLNEPFDTPEGYQLMHPGDTSLGAPAGETINCRCRVVLKVDYIGIQAAREARNG